MISASDVSILRKSSFKVPWDNSAKAPANSTPAGPPPTRTKVNQSFLLSGLGSFSAASKAINTRLRISRAFSMVFSPGAFSSQSLPKY